jgi:putative transposase
VVTPARARRLIDDLRTGYRISIRRACEVVCFDRSTYHYRHRRPVQASLRMRIRELSEAGVRYGYRRIHVLLRREGWRCKGFSEVLRMRAAALMCPACLTRST